MLSKLSNIQKDKLLHFFWGAILSFILIILFGIVGMIIALIIPAIKELYYDMYLGKGCCEWADYFYTIAPTIITDEIALVTDIRGVCSDGVTLQTT